MCTWCFRPQRADWATSGQSWRSLTWQQHAWSLHSGCCLDLLSSCKGKDQANATSDLRKELTCWHASSNFLQKVFPWSATLAEESYDYWYNDIFWPPKPAWGHIRRNRPFAKPPFCFLSIVGYLEPEGVLLLLSVEVAWQQVHARDMNHDQLRMCYLDSKTENWEATDLGNCPVREKSPKVVRRGCNRSFAPGEQKASCTGTKRGCTGAKEGLGGAKDSWKTFAPWVQKTFCTLPQSLLEISFFGQFPRSPASQTEKASAALLWLPAPCSKLDLYGSWRPWTWDSEWRTWAMVGRIRETRCEEGS